jgi:hypothetical protein
LRWSTCASVSCAPFEPMDESSFQGITFESVELKGEFPVRP